MLKWFIWRQFTFTVCSARQFTQWKYFKKLIWYSIFRGNFRKSKFAYVNSAYVNSAYVKKHEGTIKLMNLIFILIYAPFFIISWLPGSWHELDYISYLTYSKSLYINIFFNNFMNTYSSMLIWIIFPWCSVWLAAASWSPEWAMWWKKPQTRIPHWIVKPVKRKLNPSEEKPYRLRKVIKKPKPTTIITCVSFWSSFIVKTTMRNHKYRLFHTVIGFVENI